MKSRKDTIKQTSAEIYIRYLNEAERAHISQGTIVDFMRSYVRVYENMSDEDKKQVIKPKSTKTLTEFYPTILAQLQ